MLEKLVKMNITFINMHGRDNNDGYIFIYIYIYDI